MSNLLQKASIVTTPTAYGVGVLNSIKPAIPFGEELIVNGNFQNGSTGWNPSGTTNAANYVEITDNGARLVTDGTGVGIAQIIMTIGKSYKLTFNVTVATLGSAKFDGASISFSSVGSYSKTFVATQTNLTYYRNSGAADITVNNVSVKEMIDADFQFSRTSSATRVNPDYLIETVSINSDELVQNGDFSELGAEAITNGDFSVDGTLTTSSYTLGWYSPDSGLSISDGKLIITNGASVGGRAYGTNGVNSISFLTSGKSYKLVYTIEENNDNALVFYHNGGIYVAAPKTVGTHTIYFQAGGTIFILRNSTANSTIKVDNVSVKQVDPNNNWSLGTGWSFGTNKAICDGSSTFSDITQSSSIGTNLKYKVTYTILDYVSGSVKVIMNNNSASGLERNANGTYSDIITSLSNDFSFRALGSGFNGSITDISVIEIQENGVPRLDYTDGTASILLENQSTNLIAYSQDFSNAAWTKSGLSIVADATISPDGSLNADKLVEDTSTALHYCLRTFPVTSGVTYTYSIIAKYNGRLLQLSSSTAFPSSHINYDLQNGTLVIGSGAATGTIEKLTNGYYRCTYTDVANATSASGLIIPLLSNSTTAIKNPSYTGDGVSGIFMWGAQLEASSYPTSYIPTSGSTVTRAAETLNNAGNSDLINSTEGVFYVDVKFANTTSGKYISLSDKTTSNRIIIGFESGLARIYAPSFVQGFDINLDSFQKIAFSYKTNERKVYLNGLNIYTNTSAYTPPSGLFNLGFNSNGNTVQPFYGRCKTVAVFKEALSDTELACLTSTNNREIFLNYYYRMQYVGANTEALSCAEQTFNI